MEDRQTRRKGVGGSLIQAPVITRLLADPAANMAAIVEHAFEGLKPNTLRAYAKAWDDFALFIGVGSRAEAAAWLIRAGQGPANATAQSYKTSMEKVELAPTTISMRLAALKGVMKRLRIIGILNWKLEVHAPKVKGYKDTAGPGKDAVLKVLSELGARTDLKGIRDLAIVRLIYTMGLRRNEVASLDLEHLELDRDRLWILGKGRDERELVKVPAHTRSSVEAWLRVRPEGGQALFVSVDNATAGRRLSGHGIWLMTTSYGLGRPHGVRHTSITEVIDKTKDLRTAQEFSRHKDLRTLQRYDDNRKDRAGQAADLLDEGTGR